MNTVSFVCNGRTYDNAHTYACRNKHPYTRLLTLTLTQCVILFKFFVIYPHTDFCIHVIHVNTSSMQIKVKVKK